MRKLLHIDIRIIVAALFMTAASAANADVHHCNERNGHDDSLLRELYFYALFVEAANSGQLPPWRCEAIGAEPTREPPGWDTALDGTRFSFQRLSKAALLDEHG